MPRAAVIEATALATRDPLAHQLARGRINQAQYLAGREFQRCFALADKRREGNGGLADDTPVEVHVNASNCVQCGAITAKGGRLTPPEGGEGPNYQIT